MRLAHTRRPRRHVLATTDRGRREGGYVLTQFALLLIPLLLMAGLSVDVGYWYSRASDIQKAADAAALAGVVWLPDVPKARLEARKEAARNGFPDSHPDITVSAEPVPGTTRRIKVTITHDEVSSFFWSNLGGGDLQMSRSATAEYVLPVPLGSPDNVFGNDMTLPAGSRMNLWANIHGPRTNTTKGDAYATKCDGSDRCSGIPNDDYRTTGYLYAIDVPAGVTDMQVQVYDAGVSPRKDQTVDTGDVNYQNERAFDNPTAWNGLDKTTTVWTMYDKDGTEGDVADNPVATATTCNGTRLVPWSPSTTRATWSIPEMLTADTTTNPWRNQWQTICRRTGTVPQGRYLLRVQSDGLGTSANRYAVRAIASSTTKPRISGYGDMSMYNNIATGSANFYLAEVGPEHRGKILEIRLWDPGEVNGNAHMSVIHPNGSVAPSCKGDHDGSAGSGRFTKGTTLTPCTFQTSSGSARYDGLWVTLQINVPTNYSCTLGTVPGCWWKIRYDISAQASDTTTWAAQIIGDPVHLVEDGT